jgi:teichoic acid glycerol-phosphate primase
MRPIGILPNHRPSYIDHIVPLCALLKAPLFVTSPMIQQLVEIFYPEIEVLYADPTDKLLDPYLEPYDFFLYVDLFRLGTGSFWFADYFSKLKRRSLCALHGNSEKAWEIFRFERFFDEQQVLIYGESWKEHLRKIGVWDRLNAPLIGGNYRLEYYLENRDFFQRKVEQSLPHLNGKKVLLYAPTWTSENQKTELSKDYSPFLDVLPKLMGVLPKEWHLCVKIHPHFNFLYPEKVEALKEQESEQVSFLTDFPLIYPLLEKVDVYLGDYSSVGYDFLYFNRPLFFLCEQREGHLFECGTPIDPKKPEKVFEKLQETDLLGKKREAVYEMAFGKKGPSLESLKDKILERFA